MITDARRTAALKTLPALLILATLFLPLATCRDSAGRETSLRVSDGDLAGIPQGVFFVWPIVFAAIQLFVRRPRIVRTMVALEPILSIVSLGTAWLSLTALSLWSLAGGHFQLALGWYTAVVGFGAYFCISLVQIGAWLVQWRRTRQLTHPRSRDRTLLPG